MDSKQKIIIISLVVIAVLIVAALIWWLLALRPSPEAPAANTNTGIVVPLAQQIEQLPPPSAEKAREEKNYPLGLKQLAFSFAERFGSFSSDAGFSNLEELNLLMTENMRQEAEAMIAGIGNSPSYSGYETKALTSELQSFSEDSALVLVQTQRGRFLSSQAEPETFYQDILLKFIKVNGEWKVDGADWQ